MTETDLTFRIGSTVRCHDGKCGELEKVVIDPHTRRVTALVVAKGLLFPDKRVVPVSIVQEAEPDIVLDMDADDLAELPAYEERVYEKPPEGWETSTQIPTSDMIMPIMPWTVVQGQTLRPIIRYQVHQGVPKEDVVVERGTQVECVDGVIGKVDHVLITSDTGEFTHLVVDRGPLATRLIVPRELIGALGETVIRLDATKEELKGLHCVHTREDDDIEAEFRDRLLDIPLDPDNFDIEVQSGLLRVSGTVADVATKRHVEGLAWAVDGVVGVKNELDTATSLRSRVVTALANDPRTDLAAIDISAQGSVVTLAGKVDDDTVVKAAEQVAKQVEGVTEVINDLVVERDEDADVLALRSHAWARMADTGGGGTPGTTGGGARGPGSGYL
jgi:osmotically-inducible protein OsmY/sporulation protein YlmC with PRC-barrel domain